MKNNFFKTAPLILIFIVISFAASAQSKTPAGIMYNNNINLNKIEANIPAKAMC